MDTKKLVIISGAVAVGVIVGFFVIRLIMGGGQATLPPPEPISSAPQSVDVEQTIARLKSVIQQDPNNYDAWVQLGNIYFDNKQPAQSVEAYVKALAINNSSPDVHTDLGIMYRSLNRFNDALAEFSKAAAMDPRHVQSRLNMGVVYLYDLNQPEKALAAWEEVLKMEPTGERANQLRQRIDEAKQMLAKGSGQPPMPGQPSAPGMPPMPPAAPKK
jgi:cytochrome c-type biogenesis protein CcmH/NrfG